MCIIAYTERANPVILEWSGFCLPPGSKLAALFNRQSVHLLLKEEKAEIGEVVGFPEAADNMAVSVTA